MTVVMLGGAVGSALLFGWTTPLLFWIGPQVLGQPLLQAYCSPSTPAARMTAMG